jgi:hypothetical protein
MTAVDESRETPEVPFMVILRGRPDDEEIAAATVAILGLVRSRPARNSVVSGTKAPGWVPERTYTPPGFWAKH